MERSWNLSSRLFKRKNSESNKGKALSEKARRKISKIHKGKKLGENNLQSKLTEDKVRKIRAMFSTGKYTMTKLVDIFNVDRKTISQIVNCKTWKDVE